MNGQEKIAMYEAIEAAKTYECFGCDTEWRMVPELEEDVNGNSGREVDFCPYCGSALHEPDLQLHDDLNFDGETDYDPD